MICCGKQEKVEPADNPSVDFANVNRKCHDCICSAIFLAFWFGMLGVMALGVTNGDPHRLVYATDYEGDTCGQTGKGSKAYFPRMNKDLLEASSAGTSPLDTSFYTLCVDKCPEVGAYVCNGDYNFNTHGPKEHNVDHYFSRGPCWEVTIKTQSLLFRCLPEENSNVTVHRTCINPESRDPSGNIDYGKQTLDGHALYREVRGTPGTYVPTEYCETVEVRTETVATEQGQDNPLIDQLSTIGATFARWCGDIQDVLPLLFGCGCVAALLGGFGWLLLLKFAAKTMVWLTICLVLLFGVVASFVFSIKGGMIGDGDYLATGLSMANVENPIQKNEEANETMFRVLAWVSIVLTLVLFVMILFMKKKVNICVGIMREASHCLRAIPMLILWPLVPYFLFLALLVYWVVVGAFVASAGEISAAKMLALANSTLLQQASAASASLANATSAAVPASLQTLDSSKLRQYLGLYHFFGLLWTNAVIQALSMCTVAGVVSKYYWARDKTAKRAFGASPIRSSFWVCLRYHFGSLCFGALIIAVCQFVRAILAYVDHKTKGLQQSNILVKVFMKAIQCCMCCLERLLKYISKSAYVIVAMQGVSFCAATKTAFSLIFANLAQIATSNSIVSFMLLLAKVAITAGCSLLFYFAVDADPDYGRGGAKELSNPAVPLALCGLVAFFVGSTFMNLYGMVVDTILLLFCVDKRENKGKDGGYFMSDELARLLGEKNNSQKAAAAAAAAAASKAEEGPSTTTDPGAGKGKGAGAVKLQEVDT